ncbi:MAG TPA: hypothetical protein VGN07_09285 [Steroidobacteraceae bacterium]|jgi:hypothetical protein
MPLRLYEVVTETGMPHLEENLRYTTTRERRCLAYRELGTAFPVLRSAPLKGCRLDRESHIEDTVSYLLVCEGGHGTTGNAVWHIDEQRLSGTLNVKLGGKNMTFYQRITAISLGDCAIPYANSWPREK